VHTLLQIAETMGERPIIVRTLDVGGDKAIPYLALPVEANPYLGVRSIRFRCVSGPVSHQLRGNSPEQGPMRRCGSCFRWSTMVEEVGQTLQCLERAHQTLRT